MYFHKWYDNQTWRRRLNRNLFRDGKDNFHFMNEHWANIYSSYENTYLSFVVDPKKYKNTKLEMAKWPRRSSQESSVSIDWKEQSRSTFRRSTFEKILAVFHNQSSPCRGSTQPNIRNIRGESPCWDATSITYFLEKVVGIVRHMKAIIKRFCKFDNAKNSSDANNWI